MNRRSFIARGISFLAAAGLTKTATATPESAADYPYEPIPDIYPPTHFKGLSGRYRAGDNELTFDGRVRRLDPGSTKNLIEVVSQQNSMLRSAMVHTAQEDAMTSVRTQPLGSWSATKEL